MKKIALIFVALFVATTALPAQVFAPQGEMTLTWTAFKTPKKVGVKGTFDAIALSTPANAQTIESFLMATSVTIDTAKVNSKHVERDAKLAHAFFGLMKPTITAHVKAISAKTLTVAITMNGITREVPMSYSYDGKKVSAQGAIELADFDAMGALSSINNACFDLHEGKTWSDVTIAFELGVEGK